VTTADLGLFGGEIVDEVRRSLTGLESLDRESLVAAINEIRRELHRYSPFNREPVDCVLWIPSERVTANDYNPNKVAPPEMRLLEHSIAEDGFTQPIVVWDREGTAYEVVDGFHRHRVGRESPDVSERIHGYLPVTVVNTDRTERGDRIAATIRHNRARGKHQVEAMSDIVVELKRRNWSNEKIALELGMDQDEVLRLCQITGLSELFSDSQFSKAWEVNGEITEADFDELGDDVDEYEDEVKQTRTVNTSDEGRIFHTFYKWECYRAGFYATTVEGKSKSECEQQYRDFLADDDRFAAALNGVITEWKHSCEHYLTNVAMNRIAWLGQAAACYDTGLPSMFRGGFWLLTTEQQHRANEIALEYLNKWLIANDREPVTMDQALADRQSDIY
jgi:ParB-like chromosome segregation protein Spo0J